MTTIHTLATAGLVVIKDRKLLLAFSLNKQAFYLPGGKVDAGETSQSAVIRETREEMNVDLDPAHLRFYSHITAPAFGERPELIMEQDCFLYDLQQTPHPSSEIGALNYFDTESYRKEPQQVPGVVLLMEQLKQDGLIR
ncbi:NUDIX hydrolase [Flavitalea flava]